MGHLQPLRPPNDPPPSPQGLLSDSLARGPTLFLFTCRSHDLCLDDLGQGGGGGRALLGGTIDAIVN